MPTAQDPLTALIADLSDPAATSAQLATIAGAPVALRIDIADPPVPVVAMIGQRQGSAPTADAAVHALGQAVVSAMQLGQPVSEIASDVVPAPSPPETPVTP